MDYFYSEKDSKGFVHSIDNLVIVYDYYALTYNQLRLLLPLVKELGERYKTRYYERLDLNACSHYHFAKDFVHLDDGIMLYFGFVQEKLFAMNPKDKNSFWIMPKIKLEMNPNKHAEKPVVKELLELLTKDACDIAITKYDYAIDLPKSLEDVQVFSTRKERGLHKGTRYFGERSRNGFTRIYDKAKEQNLDEVLTRVETTVSLVKGTKKLSFEKVHYKSEHEAKTDVKMSRADEAILELCRLCHASGIDYSDALAKLERRKRYFIQEQLAGCSYELLEPNEEIIDRLLAKYLEFFGASSLGGLSEDEPKEELVNDEFVPIPDNIDLPFD